MKKFNKFFIISLVIVLVLALAACDKSPSAGDTNSTNNTEAVTNGDDTTSTDSTVDTNQNDPTTSTNPNGNGTNSPNTPTESTNPSDTDSTQNTEDAVPSHKHSYNATVIAPTCVVDGYTVYKCDCGDSYKGNATSAPGHKWGEWKTVQEPTTTTDGKAERKCSVCNKIETKTLPKQESGHTHKYTAKVTTAATCTKEGVKTFTCSCGGSYTESIEKKPHEYRKSSTVAPTCTTDGYSIYKCKNCAAEDIRDRKLATGHSYSGKVTAPTCTQQGYTTYTCSDCRDAYTKDYTAANGHNYAVATCTTPPTCKICKATKDSALGHKWDGGTVTTKATCSKDGVKTYTCVNDKSHTKTEVIEKDTNAHNWNSGKVTTAATCGKDGVKTYTCNNNSSHTYTESVPKTDNHKIVSVPAVDPTCSKTGLTEGKKCKTCGYVSVKQETIPKADHVLSTTTVAATCEKNAYDLTSCKNCTYTKTTEKPNTATGKHTMELVSNTATCTFSGVKTYKCKNCSKTTTENVSATGSHTMETTTVAKAATKVAALGNSALSKYNRMTDVNVDYCSKCGYVDYTSAASIYTASQETAILIDLMRGIRTDFLYSSALEAEFSEEGAQEYVDRWKHVSDKTCINHAIKRAKAIVTDYSHNGMPSNCAENIGYGHQNITEQYNSWRNSLGHYNNMTHWGYPYVGFSRYIVGDQANETITIYAVVVFGYHDR